MLIASRLLSFTLQWLLTHGYSGGGKGGWEEGPAQSSLLNESQAVLILFVWPHTFSAFLSGKR